MVGEKYVEEDCRVCNHIRKHTRGSGPNWFYLDGGLDHIFDSQDAYIDLARAREQFEHGEEWDFAVLFRYVIAMPRSGSYCSVCRRLAWKRKGIDGLREIDEAWLAQLRRSPTPEELAEDNLNFCKYASELMRNESTRPVA